MLAIALTFPARRFHATPWGRQVNEGAVEWPPSPWRLLRALVSVWHHKFPEVEEVQVSALMESLSPPPHFVLPPASQGHTRHYMPLVDGSKTKVFDTFITLSDDDRVIVYWPTVELLAPQRSLLARLLESLTYFGRAESWVCGQLLEENDILGEVVPCEQGIDPPVGFELVKTLALASPAEHAAWVATRSPDVAMTTVSRADSKGAKPKKPPKPPKKKSSGDWLPTTLFDALHIETAALRKGGWNQPPGSRWINYLRPSDAFAPRFDRARTKRTLAPPTVVRFAISSAVRPNFIEALWIGERVRRVAMSHSQAVMRQHLASDDANASFVFSGKDGVGQPTQQGHRHAHFLSESTEEDGKISHMTLYAHKGFDAHDLRALERLQGNGVWGKGSHDLQMVLLGAGQPADFGGTNQTDGMSRILAESKVWVSRTPFVPTRHLHLRPAERRNPELRLEAMQRELVIALKEEFVRRDWLKALHSQLETVEPLLERDDCGIMLRGHFTSWLKFKRERVYGNGHCPSPHGYGFRLTFKQNVRGPIVLGYGSHFGLGQFQPA